MLPDLLEDNLKLVICGTAAGEKSALAQFYYHNTTNKFYRTLHNVGLTRSLISSTQYNKLLSYGIGLTDLVKGKAGMDNILSKDDYDVKGFKEKIIKYNPAWLCFNGKEAAKNYFGTNKVYYGEQIEDLANTKIFIACSTSGAANGSWDINLWHELSNLVKQ